MLEFLARRGLRRFAERYDYDVTYMQHMLDTSPSGFFKFAKLTRLALHRESAPVAAVHAGKIVGALAEDCGPCVQLVVAMAREAGMSVDTIAAVLAGETETLDADVRLGAAFARALVERGVELAERREAVRARWGDKGVLDLVLAVQIGRIFPMVKVGLGHGEACRLVELDGRRLAVAARPVRAVA